MLEDGRYDAFVISAEEIARANTRDDDVDDVDDADDAPSVLVSLTILTGAHKGDVVDVRMSRIGTRDAIDTIDMIGLPCTLVVAGGVPRIEP